MRRRTVVMLGLVVVAALGLGLAGAREAGIDVRFQKVRDAMADRNYPEANRLAGAFFEDFATTPRGEEALVLRIRALEGMERHDEAVRLALAFLEIEEYAKSPWREKVRFLMADAHARARGFKTAARLYRARVETLAADDHQATIAADYREIAETAYEGRTETDRFGRETLVKDHRRALTFFLKARAIHEDPAERDILRHRIADCAANVGDHAQAIREWTALLDEDATSKLRDEATYRIGESHLLKGRQADARTFLRRIVETFPDSPRAPEARILLGRSFDPLNTGDEDAFRQGIAWWTAFAELNFSHEKAPGVFFDIAAAHSAHGDHAKAIAGYAAFLGRFGENEKAPEARYLMGMENLARREFDQAIVEFKAFLGHWPNHALWTKAQEMIVEADFLKGAIPYREKKWDEAVAAWTRFLETHPLAKKAPHVRLSLGDIEKERKRFDEAVAAWRILAGKYPKDPRARQGLLRIARVLEREKGDHEAALHEYEEIVKLYPRTGEARSAAQAIEAMKAKRLVVSTERAFRTDQKPVLHAELRNIERLKFKAYRLDLEEYFRRKHRVASIEDVVVAIVKADPEWTDEPGDYRAYLPVIRDLDLSRLKGPGAWIVTCGEEDLTATSLVVVSDLQVVVKQSPHQVFTFVVDERTGKPVRGARVLLGDGEGVFSEGVTRDDGTYVFEDEKTVRKDVRVLVVHEGHVATSGSVSGGGTSWGYTTKAYLYTDRPLYRPGQTVEFRGIVRKVAGGDYATPVGETVKLWITDPRGTVLFENEVKTSDYGTLDGRLVLPDEAHLGDYVLRARYRDHDFRIGFKVMEYKKPEFTATIRTEKPAYLTGETVNAKVRLRYTFGGAVAGTTVDYQVLRMPFTFDADALESFAWFFSDPARAEERRRQALNALTPVAEGRLTTDANGETTLTFETDAVEEDRAYVVAVRAQDINREWISDQKTVFVTQKGWFAMVRTDRKVYRPKEKVTASITTVNVLQMPVAARGKIAVLRRLSTIRRNLGRPIDDEKIVRGPGRSAYEIVDTIEGVETLANGKGTAAFRIEKAGEYVIRFEGADSRGGIVLASTPVDVSGEAEDLAKQARIVAEQEIYMEGDVAKVLVNTPRAPALALLTFEGEKVLKHRIVTLTARSNTLDVPMDARFSPNVFLRVAIAADGELYEDEEEVAVLKFLNVEVTTDRTEVRPGETVKARVRSTDQKGRPVPAELSLAVVDGSIFAMAPDGTPDIKPTFYDQRRKNAVVTSSSHAFKYAGLTRPTNKDLLAEESRRLGAEQYVVLRRYVREGKEALDAGDYAKAVDMLGRALELSPSNYEARSLVAMLQSRTADKRPSANGRAPAARKELLKKLARLTATDDAMPMEEPSIRDEAAFESRKDEKGAWATGGGGAVGGKRGGRVRLKNKSDAYDSEEESEDADAGPPAGILGGRLNIGRRPHAPTRPKAGVGYLAGLVAHQAARTFVPTTLRETFADTARWWPAIRTDGNGTAEVELTLPDNLTTWRLTARGVSTATLVGEARAVVVARKPLLVRIDTPRFLTQGDRTTITSSVHNNTGDEADVRLDLTARNVDVKGSQVVGATIRDRGASVFDWRLAADAIGLVEIEATARSTRGSDAMKQGLRTLPHGLPHRDGRSGLVDGEALEVLERPAAVIPGTLRFALSISPDVDATLFEGIGELETFPYDCLEQTINRFLPAIAAHDALTSLGIPDEAMKRRLGEVVNNGLNSIYAFQAADGSFGWWQGGKGDPVMTAYAVIAMELSRLAGFRVNASNRDRALKAAVRLVRGGTNRQKAFLLRALALGGKADFKLMNAVHRYRDGLDPIGLAILALAFRDSGRSYNAHELVRMLSNRVVVDGDLAHWGAATKARDRRGAFLAGDVEATSYALLALLSVEPKSPLCDPAARWLETHRRGAGWGTTKATGTAVRALAAWQKTRRAARHDFTVEVWWNGKLYQKVPVRGSDVTPRSRIVLLDAARFKAGRNELKLVRVGSGTFRYALSYEYVTPAETIPAAGNLIAMERRYVEYVSPLKEKKSGERVPEGFTIVRPEARPKVAAARSLSRVGSGDRFRVLLTLTARADLDYVILEDPLPSGVEVVEGQARGPFDHQERRDESQVFFLSHVEEGARVEISYLCQAIHPGTYRALPTVAYPMYEPEVFGRAAGRGLEIRPESGIVGRRPDVESLTPDAIFFLAKKAFADERWNEAQVAFAGLIGEYKLLDGYHEECLWYLMKCAFARSDARGAVEAYESLRERNPRRGVATREEKLALAASYFEIAEFERALILYRGLTDEMFAQEAAVAETYRSLNDPHRAQARLADVVRRYPDSGSVVAAEWALARQWFDLRRPIPKKDDGPARIGGPALMLPESLEAFRSFSAHHPEHPEADAAGYMGLAALQRMDLLAEAVAEAEAFRRRYPTSIRLAKVTYDLCMTYFDKGDFAKAREVGQEILTREYRYDRASTKTRPSKYRPNITFLMGQMAHSEGRYAEAVKHYEQVEGRFSDARDALAFFTATGLRLPESALCGLDEVASFKAETKNLKSLALKVYEVDLMILFAVRKDLKQINRIDLTGIVPIKEWTVSLDEGRDYRWHEERVPVPADHKGVYLVVVKGGDHDGSTVVIKSDLEIKVQRVEDRVRVYTFHRKTREPMREVYVKVSDGSVIRAQGLTDTRGVFEARGVRGTASVVAEKDGHYALSR